MKTISQQIKWDFTNGPLEIKDKNGNPIYSEDSTGYWLKREYDSRGKVIYFENSDGFWYKTEYDDNGNLIYYEKSSGEIISYF